MQTRKLIDGNDKLKLNYLNTENNFVSGSIREYDIHSAYLSIIRETNLLQYFEQYEQKFLNQDFTKLQKKDYLVFIGNMINKYNWLSDFLHDWLRYLLASFIDLNNIPVENVLSIKKDAVFIIGNIAKIRTISNIDINLKNSYDLWYSFKSAKKSSKIIEVYSNRDETIIKNLFKSEWKNTIIWLNNELIRKLDSFDLNTRMKLIESFENKYFSRRFKDISIYSKNGKTVRTVYGLDVEIEKYKDMNIEEVDIEETYMQVIRPIIQTYIKENL